MKITVIVIKNADSQTKSSSEQFAQSIESNVEHSATYVMIIFIHQNERNT